MADNFDGSSAARCMRRSVSRQEMPASMRMLVSELERTAVLPRDPEASTVIRTMERRIDEKPVGKRVNKWLLHWDSGRGIPCHGQNFQLASTFSLPVGQYLGGNNPLSRSEEHTSELQSRFDLVCRL